MGAIALWLKSKFLGNSLAWIFIGTVALVLGIIVIPNMEQIKEKLGFETRTTLKVQVQEQQEVIKDLSIANTGLAEIVQQQEEIHQVENEQINKQAEVVEQTTQVVNKVIENKVKHIKTIKASTTVDKDKVKQISTTQINSIWDTYCNFNTSSDCTPGA